jgi:hypothetical protein
MLADGYLQKVWQAAGDQDAKRWRKRDVSWGKSSWAGANIEWYGTVQRVHDRRSAHSVSRLSGAKLLALKALTKLF